MQKFAVKQRRVAPNIRKAKPVALSNMVSQRRRQAGICNILRSTGAQAKLTIGQPNDKYEQEADRVADKVMRMRDADVAQRIEAGRIQPMQIQRMCPECEEETAQRQPIEEEEETLQAKEQAGQASKVGPGLESRINSLKSGGQPLDPATRSFFEPRFGQDFSNVRIHNSGLAADASRSINARAFTLGNNVVFASNQYQPQSSEGRRLLGHELTHTIQQKENTQLGLQKSDFCKPYATAAEAADAERWLRNTYMRAEGIESFGTEVYNLYDSYLNRSPGNSLTPRVFTGSGHIYNSFKNDGYITDDMDNVIDLIYRRLHRAPGGTRSMRVSPHYMSLTNFLSSSEMNSRPINFSNPFSVSGHIAGGLSSSDAGDDYRKITRATVAISKIILFGNTGYYLIELSPDYEVFDAIDFCPGGSGSPLESLITVPMSRLEASGKAYDMPFKVVFSPESRSKRFWF